MLSYVPNQAQAPLRKAEIDGLRRGDLDVQSEVMVGLLATGTKFRFRCPVCLKLEVNDQRMEPACTGPGWTDSHPLTPMTMLED